MADNPDHLIIHLAADASPLEITALVASIQHMRGVERVTASAALEEKMFQRWSARVTASCEAAKKANKAESGK